MDCRSVFWKSTGSLICLIILLLLPSNLHAQFPNVQIVSGKGAETYFPNEPSIALHPKYPDRLLVVTNGPFGNYHYSTDRGETWTSSDATALDRGYWGDPCLIADTSGHFFLFHLELPPKQRRVDRVMCRMMDCLSMDRGWVHTTFTGQHPITFQDKEWAAYDPTHGALYVTWTRFDLHGSGEPEHKSNIMFSGSSDGGAHWQPSVRINETSGDCLDDDGTVEGAMPAVGPQGEIYVTWAGPEGIVFDRSNDHGETWMKEDIRVSDNPGGWYFPEIPGLFRCGGQPVIACDRSGGPFRGRVYILWSDEKNGQKDHDIWLSVSLDGGLTWSRRKRIHDDPPGHMQFLYWMTIDQKTGIVYVIYHDRRRFDDDRTDVYLAFSADGGGTFQNVRISESPFTPVKNRFLGDYPGLVAYDDIIRPVWIRYDEEGLSLWTALIDGHELRTLSY